MYTFGSFTFSHFIPHMGHAMPFPLEPKQKRQLSVSAKRSRISSSSLKMSLRKMQREEPTCLLGPYLGCLSFTAQGVSNPTVTSKVAGCIEIPLQVLDCLAGTLAVGSHPHTDCREGQPPHTDRAVQVTFTAHCAQAKLQYSKFGYICINVILNWHTEVLRAKECPGGSVCKSELRYCHRLIKFICQNAF